jgi:hypothetical protein
MGKHVSFFLSYLTTQNRAKFQISLFILLVLLSGSVRADWVKGHFSPEAKIDSINRFLVISDSRDSTFLGYGVVRAGDINKDGIADVIICRSKNSQPYADDSAFLYLGGTAPAGVPIRSFAHLKYTLGNIGDVNADGYDDFGLCDLPFTNYHFILGGASQFDSTYQLLNGFYTRIAKAVDLDSDGKLEVPISRDINGGFVYIFQVGPTLDTIPKYIIPDTAVGFGRALATGDFNGDGWPDLAVSACFNRDTEFVKFYWGGPQFDTVADWTVTRAVPDQRYGFGKVLVPTGDFNGDGIEDLYIGANFPVPFGIHFGGPTINSRPDIAVNSDLSGGYNVLTNATLAGDVNHDGYPDFITSYPLPDNSVFIYLGGPSGDSIPDVVIQGHILAGFAFAFGSAAIAGVGDFNGDGIDDFAVSSKTDIPCCWTSQVNFFAGWKSVSTDAPGESARSQLNPLNLSNFPNPFNASTSIEFTLNRTSIVDLTIVNSLGQQVRKLSNSKYPSGRHVVRWDSTDDMGRIVASGTYILRISDGEFQASHKLILLK